MFLLKNGFVGSGLPHIAHLEEYLSTIYKVYWKIKSNMEVHTHILELGQQGHYLTFCIRRLSSTELTCKWEHIGVVAFD